MSGIDIALNAVALVLGILMHFAKRKWKGQTTADISNYFKTHVVDTIVVVISSVVVFAIAYQTGTLNFLSSFAAGFACDSAFNKAMGDTDKNLAEKK